jgi:Xaa-Pro aminopeptidase
VSNEPGYYKPGAYGIRIENLIAVVELPQPPGAERQTLGFSTLTLVPYERRLIELGLLSPEERAFVDDYHARVREVLSPLVDAATARYLNAATEPLQG